MHVEKALLGSTVEIPARPKKMKKSGAGPCLRQASGPKRVISIHYFERLPTIEFGKWGEIDCRSKYLGAS
jgi:hypothetical protein